MNKLRPSQQKIMEYKGGMMGVAAVPGSGKTWTLSLLAADIITEGRLRDGQEVLIVTLVNSAVDNFYHRVGRFIKESGLIPNIGYRVRTLHGLAHDIVRERPDLVGLADDFLIIDERETQSIRNQVARTWLHNHPYDLDEYLDPNLEEGRREWVRRQQLPNLIRDIALGFIRYAKDKRLTPELLRKQLESIPVPLALAEMGCELYEDYQRALVYRGGVDFDDLIRLAIQALEEEPEYTSRLHHKWPFVLEDEAQDSSQLQERILEKIVGDQGNWVRVGDPNQAIFETFTTADPVYLRNFISRSDVVRRELKESGRSTLSIVELANKLVEWTENQDRVPEVNDALQHPPLIERTPKNDPQPNPVDEPEQVQLIYTKFSPKDEIRAVADSLERWIPDNDNKTVAVLVPRNYRGFEIVDELRRRGIDFVDGLLQSSSSTRFSAGVLGNLLQYLSDPQSSKKLARVYEVWRRAEREDKTAWAEVSRTGERIRKLQRVEDFIWSEPGYDLIDEFLDEGLNIEVCELLRQFRDLVRRWQSAVLLPVDQIVLTVAQELMSEPVELALAQKLAVMLKQAARTNPSWRLPELTAELSVIARNERRFIGFSADDGGFDPDKYKGKVVVSTMHKAKGLEWDRVYLMSVNSYNFPFYEENDTYIAEKWFIRDRLNLQAETLEQLDIAISTDEYAWYEEGLATDKARLDYVRERLRLFYVGVTRARRQLIVTWNTGRAGKLTPSVPFLSLDERIDSLPNILGGEK